MRFARTATAFMASMVILTSACASGGASADGTDRPSTRRDIITQAELIDIAATNAYDAILRLRPAWFRTRGQAGTQGGGIKVYIDGVNAGDLERLRVMSIDRVREMRRISASDATTRWGTGHTSGAIEVITRG